MVEEERVREIVDEAVDPLRDSLFGPKHSATGERIKSEGMEYKLDVVHNKITNGGIPASLRFTRNTKIVLAFIGFAQTVLVTVLVAVFA